MALISVYKIQRHRKCFDCGKTFAATQIIPEENGMKLKHQTMIQIGSIFLCERCFTIGLIKATPELLKDEVVSRYIAELV